MKVSQQSPSTSLILLTQASPGSVGLILQPPLVLLSFLCFLTQVYPRSVCLILQPPLLLLLLLLLLLPWIFSSEPWLRYHGGVRRSLKVTFTQS